ncbi:MAG: SUMF1/EgtB/PvdO family nonheme iron enzyme, partial [Candidatus Eisenbacteria bacterium]|nr:SUMF1/EgtB/PvdO family nonheme iron enzyme [Candidatus Eisenbacteria bacterium]
WRQPDSLPGEPFVLQVRLAADTLSDEEWEDHRPGRDLILHNPGGSQSLIIFQLQPATGYLAGWRLMYADSSLSPITDWSALETTAVPEPTELKPIAGGSFVMGSDAGEGFADEAPERVLELPDYYLERTEVTNAQYWLFMEAGGYEDSRHWSSLGWAWKEANRIEAPRGWETGTNKVGLLWPDHPVMGVSYHEAAAYARWADRRLPTEAEWEKAGRGGCELRGGADCDDADELPYPWGLSTNPRRFNYNGSEDPYEPGTTPVGFYDGREVDGYSTYDSGGLYGVYDLAGNAAEWTASRFAPYPYDPGDGRETPPGEQSEMAVRGGSWSGTVTECRVSYRTHWRVDQRSFFVGFRCAADEDPGP